MKPKLTNVRARVGPHGPPDAAVPCSIVEMESTIAPVRWLLEHQDPRRLRLRLKGLALNMDPFEMTVGDGLIQRLRVDDDAAPDAGVVVELALDLPLREPARVEVRPGLPALVRVVLDRSPLRAVLGGRRIVVDPGHGGPDTGAKGPVNLREKDITLAVSRRLAAHLGEAGSRVFLTRTADVQVPAHQRLLRAVENRAEVMLSLHCGHDPDRRVRGVRTLYTARHAAGERLAHAIHAAILARLPLADRGVTTLGGEDGVMRAARVGLVVLECVTITNPLDEALLRSVTFKDRLAKAVRNGLLHYFAGVPEERGGQDAVSSLARAHASHPAG